MQYKKSYDHLNVTATAPQATVTPSPTPTPPAPRPVATPQKSIIPKVIIVALSALIIYLGYSLLPKNFSECQRFPGSKVSLNDQDTCRTFYGATFNETSMMAGTRPTPTPAPSLDSATPSPSPRDPVLGSESETDTTKGGLPAVTPTPTSRPIQAVPTPTTAPDTGTVPSDWIRHRYPTQSLSFYMPRGWTGSTAVRNRDTGITTFSLGGQSVQVSLQPNWNNTGNANQRAINYEVAGISAIKVTGDTHTTVYFERGPVHIFSCHNSVWNTCATILKSLTFTN
jgi:hypothetical protein